MKKEEEDIVTRSKEEKKKKETCLCPDHKLPYHRPAALLQRVEHQRQRAGAVPQVEQLLQEQERMRSRVRLRRSWHSFPFFVPLLSFPCPFLRASS